MRSMTLTALLALALATLTAPASAQPAANYPNKPIRFIIGFGAGTDLLARIVAQKLSENVGQPVIVENRTGAAGRIAVEHVQSQPADGHVVLIGAIGQLAVSTAVYPDLPF